MEKVFLNTLIDPNNEKIRKDVLLLIHNHLKSENLLTSALILKDECSSKCDDIEQLRLLLLKLKKLIISGDNWDNCHVLISSIISSSPIAISLNIHHSRFSCHLYKYEYLQLINSSNIDNRQKAFNFLMQKLKPYEDLYETEPGLFNEFCYLLTCKSVAESNKFRLWRDTHKLRVELADNVCNTINEYFISELYIGIDNDTNIEDNNLMSLVQQAMAYQVAKTSPSSILSIINNNNNNNDNPLSSDSSKQDNSHSVDITEDEKIILRKPNITGIINSYKPQEFHYKCDAILSHYDTTFGCNKSSSSLSSSHALKCVGMHTYGNNSFKSEYNSLFIGGHDGGILNFWETLDNKKENIDDIFRIDESIDSSRSDIHEVLSPLATFKIRLNNSRTRIRGDRYTCTQVLYTRNNNGLDDDFDDYDITDDKMRSVIPPPKIRDICIAPQGDQFATSLSDGNIIFLNINRNDSNSFDTKFCTSLSSIEAHDGDIFSIYYQPDGKQIISGGMDKSVCIHDLNNMSCLKSFKGHTGSICNVQSNNIGNLIISSSKDGAVKFWDLLSGLCVNTIQPMTMRENDDTIKKIKSNNGSNNGEITSSILSYDGRYLLVTSRFSAPRIIDIRNSKILTRFKGYSNFDHADTGSHYRASFCASDTKVATGGIYGTVNIWDVSTGTLNTTLSLNASTTIEDTKMIGIQEYKSNSNSPIGSMEKNKNPVYSMFNKSSIFDTKVDQRIGMMAASSSVGISIWR